MFEETDRVIKANSNNLNVLNHGDMWVNNSMFCYDEETGHVKDVQLVNCCDQIFDRSIDKHLFLD